MADMNVQMNNSMFFQENYYHYCCGELPYDDPRWKPTFERIAEGIIRDYNPKTVLDVGCAMGYLVEALRDRGVEAYGIDISDYAISKVREDIRPFCCVSSALEALPEGFPKKYDVLTTIEVVEHLHEEESERFIKNICKYADVILFSSSPSDVSEATHFNVQQPEYWVKRFAKVGLRRNLICDCTFISPQAMCFCRDKINWPSVVEDYERAIRQAAEKNDQHIAQVSQDFQAKLDEAGKQFGELETSYREEQSRGQQLQVKLDEAEAASHDLQEKLIAAEHDMQEKLGAAEHDIQGLSERIKALENDLEKEKSINETLIQENAQANLEIENSRQVIGGKQGEIDFLCNQVRERDGQLQYIYGSRCYRLVLKYYRFKDLVIPRGSKRFICAKTLFRLPRYVVRGYPIKLAKYVARNGFNGLGGKIRGVVMDTPALPAAQLQLESAGFAGIDVSFSLVRHAQNVDIVICVHNAYEDVKRCIESVFEFTAFPYHVIIVDDGSDEKTRDYLRSVKESSPNVSLIRNETGRGYTFAANAGLRASSGDYVVMLNSDTIVTPDWLDKMIMCANSSQSIGIVGPLSNTASWQSVPEIFDADGDWCHNVLPEGYTVERFARELEDSSAHLYFRVPLLNGFCLMISRDTIDRIGYFDEETFGQGFGEEDDYNLRAYEAGIGLAVADDTFVFHAQSKSYSDERRKALCEVSGKKVREKHGDQLLDSTVMMIRDNPILSGIRARTSAMIRRNKVCASAKNAWEGKRVLFILPIADAGGGGNVIMQEAAALQKMGIDVWLFNFNILRPFFERSYPDIQIPVIYGEKYEDIKDYASDFDIVCSTLFTTVKYTDFREMQKAPVVMYYIQDYEPYFYDEGTAEYNEAANSYTAVPGMIRVTKTSWNAQEVWKHHSVTCNILKPSVNIDLFRPRRGSRDNDPIRITAMVRPSTPRRAPRQTMEILREIKLKYADRVEISVFGADFKDDEDNVQFLQSIQTDFEFCNMGKLNVDQVAGLFSETDIFVDFSYFQAMGLSAMEAMASGCAVIVPANGGTGDFAKNGVNSIVVDTQNKEACISSLEKLIEDGELRKRISEQAIIDMCQFAPEYSALRFLEAAFGEVGYK